MYHFFACVGVDCRNDFGEVARAVVGVRLSFPIQTLGVRSVGPRNRRTSVAPQVGGFTFLSLFFFLFFFVLHVYIYIHWTRPTLQLHVGYNKVKKKKEKETAGRGGRRQQKNKKKQWQ